MVNGLTKLKVKEKVNDKVIDRVDDKKTYEEVYGAAIKYPGILLIKLADRLHNWETVDAMSLSKRAEAVKETREFFGVIAKYLKLNWVIDDFARYINVVLGQISESEKADELFKTIFDKGYRQGSKSWMGELVGDFKRRGVKI